MNDNEDVKKQLEVKNKEIYRNKLNLDIDNNLEVLVLAIDNMLSSLTSNAVSKIIEIEESFLDKKQIENDLNTFMNNYRENLMNLLASKKIFLQENLIISDDLKKITTNLDNHYQLLKTNLEKTSKRMIIDLLDDLKTILDTDFKLTRLKTYLQDIFLVNLNSKVLEIIKSRDIILLNTFNETYLKYLELNKNTVGVS